MIHRSKIMVVGALVTLAVLLLVIILGDNGVVELDRLRETRRTLIEENAALTRENLHLYRTIDRLQNDPTFVENVARRELGMIRPDELIFQFKSEAQKK